MSEIVVVIPSRGRPQRACEVLMAALATASLPSTRYVLAVDEDDPALAHYHRLFELLPRRVRLVELAAHQTGNLVCATNSVSMRIARERPASIIANWGDDHLPRSSGWDRAVSEALHEPGIAYGNDLLQGAYLPTAPFISAAIPLALGWYALPSVRHMFIDDAWKALGQAIGRLHYLPDVIIEHLHPAAGKAEWDDSYRASNAHMQQDREAYLEWERTYKEQDVAQLRNL